VNDWAAAILRVYLGMLALVGMLLACWVMWQVAA
jgi:hypothetical protein